MKENRWVLSLAAVAAFLIFMKVNAPSLDSDGIHYASAAKEIARSGHWLNLRDPILQKRYYWHFPMSVWPAALCFKLFGISPGAAKLYSMGMTLLAVAGLYLLGRVLSGPWTGWIAGLTFLLTNHVLRIARQCRPDLPLIAFLVWAFLGLVLAQSRPPRRKWYLLTGIACWGAIMTKEMVGLVPLAAAAVYFVLRRQWRELVHPAFWACVLLAVGPVWFWLTLERVLFGNNFWQAYRQQSVDFYMHAQHLAKPWYYYLQAILQKDWYHLPLTLAGGWLAWGKIRKGEEPRWGLILLWAAALPAGFSLANHKVHYYILPTYAAASLLVGLACDRWISLPWRRRIWLGVSGLTAVAALVLAGWPLLTGRDLVPQRLRYAENIQIAPQIDAVLAESPGDVLVVRQDAASLFFYTRRITNQSQCHNWPVFGQKLAAESPRRRYCLIGHQDWELVPAEVRSFWKVVLDDGARFFLRRDPA